MGQLEVSRGQLEGSEGLAEGSESLPQRSEGLPQRSEGLQEVPVCVYCSTEHCGTSPIRFVNCSNSLFPNKRTEGSYTFSFISMQFKSMSG